MQDTVLDAVAASAMPQAAFCQARTEGGVLWQAGESQIVNAGVFVLALVFCWLVLPLAWALYRYLKTAHHRYVLTDQRLFVESGIVVKKMETLELYRVKDMSVSGTLLQTLVGRAQVILHTTDATSPTLVLNAIPDATHDSQLIRNTVEECRMAKGVRSFDY